MAEPSPSWSETIAPNEAAAFDALAGKLRAIQHARAPADRALHAKAHGGLLGELSVLPDLPAWTRVGIFEKPGSYRAYARFSNGSGARQGDSKGDVRGIAVKVVGVPGKKLIPGMEGAATQDFLGILSPAPPFRTPAEFVGTVVATSGSPLLLLPRLFAALGWQTFKVLGALNAGRAHPVTSMAEQTFYSALPIRWGNHAVKYSFLPDPVPAPPGLVPSDAPDHLANDLRARLAAGPLAWTLRVQGYVDAARTPIEDPTKEWLPADAPWVPVARLTLPQQDAGSERGKRLAAWVETLSFDPWHAPEEFRPLGALMRARGAAYRESGIERKSAAEPDGSESWG